MVMPNSWSVAIPWPWDPLRLSQPRLRFAPLRRLCRRPVPAAMRLLTLDAAVLEAQDVRKDLPCTVTPIKPALGFDLKFHAGYEVSCPAQGAGRLGEPAHHGVPRDTRRTIPIEPVYFSQTHSGTRDRRGRRRSGLPAGHLRCGRGQLPHRLADARPRPSGSAPSTGISEASCPAKDKQMALDIAADVIRPADTEPFKQERRWSGSRRTIRST